MAEENKTQEQDRVQQWLANPTVEEMPEQVLAYLQSKGLSPQEFVDFVTSGAVYGTTFDPGAGFTNIPELKDAFNEIAGGRMREPEEEESEAQTSTYEQVLAASRGEEVDPAVQSDFAQEISQMLALDQGGAAPWIFGQSGALFGVGPDRVDFAEMWDMAVDMFGPLLEPVQRLEGESLDSWKARSMTVNLQQPNELNQFIVQRYADNLGHSWRQAGIHGFKIRDLVEYGESYDLDPTEALGLGMTGKAYGMDLGESARLYANLRNAGVDINIPGSSLRQRIDLYEDEDEGEPPGRTYTGREPDRPSYDDLRDLYMERQEQLGMGRYFRRFQEAKAEYGSEVVAHVAMHDRDLASRLFTDPWSLSVEELLNVEKYVGDPGQYSSVRDISAVNWLADRLQGGQDVIKVDIEGAREAARTLASAWNLPQLSDSMINAIAEGVVFPQIQAYKQSLGNPFNPTLSQGPATVNTPSPYAEAARQLRNSGIYGEYFADLPSGMSEEDYVGQFTSETQRLLGRRDVEAERAGMRAGDTNVVGQNILTSGEGSDSSTFRRRLAQLGEAFRAET